MTIDPQRLAVAQAAVAAIQSGVSLTWQSGFWFQWTARGKTVRRKWVAMSRGSDFPVWSDKAPWGGTCCHVFTQLMRWVRGEAVVPLRCWRYWVEIGVSPQALELVAAAGWPEVVPCVFCGRLIQPAERFDDFNFEGHTGPGCNPYCEGWKRACDERRESRKTT